MFTESEYRSAKRAASSVARLNKGYLDAGDILGAIYEWMMTHSDKIEEWREGGHKGYLNTALYRAGLRYAMAERKRITGAQSQDLHFYSPGQLEEILPYIWDYEDWFLSIDSPAYIRSGVGDPATGNVRLATLVDVSSAVLNLPDADDIEFLRLRYEDGIDFTALGLRYELTEDGARKRHKRILNRLVRDLGGDPPWFGGPGSRKAMSNAAAQMEVRQ